LQENATKNKAIRVMAKKAVLLAMLRASVQNKNSTFRLEKCDPAMPDSIAKDELAVNLD
jgi:hypothetical protein